MSRPAGAPSSTLREANAHDLLGWDALTVARRRGHVYQSRAYARHLASRGWRTRFLVFEDGVGVVSYERTWPAIGGGSAYLIRGPVPTDDDPAVTAARLEAIVAALAPHGIDVVATDAEVPAESGYPALLAARGFRPIPEIQPSRHRMSLPLGSGVDEAAVLAGVSRSTRQRIAAAERGGLSVVRHDLLGEAAPLERLHAPREATATALDRFWEMLLVTGDRRGFTFGPRAEFVPWWEAAHADGLLVLLEARAGDEPIAGLLLHRHGGRLSTVHSADRPETRGVHPGALHLLRWSAARLAIAEGCSELDLGGVDVAGARRPPREGEPMWGLYEHKRSFGAVWVELAGAHERVVDAAGYRTGTILAGIRRRLRGSSPDGGTGSAG